MGEKIESSGDGIRVKMDGNAVDLDIVGEVNGALVGLEEIGLIVNG